MDRNIDDKTPWNVGLDSFARFVRAILEVPVSNSPEPSLGSQILEQFRVFQQIFGVDELCVRVPDRSSGRRVLNAVVFDESQFVQGELDISDYAKEPAIHLAMTMAPTQRFVLEERLSGSLLLIPFDVDAVGRSLVVISRPQLTDTQTCELLADAVSIVARNLNAAAAIVLKQEHRTLERSASDLRVAVIVAQSVRHEVRSLLGEVTEILLLADRKKVSPAFDQLDRLLTAVGDRVESLRIASLGSSNDPVSLVDVRQGWSEAVSLMAHAFGREDVVVKVVGSPPSSIYIEPTDFRNLCVQLLQNSLDAFKERKGKRDRVVSIRISCSTDQNSCEIRYSDNAGGIDPSRLRGTDLSSKPLAEAVFDLGTTSKKGGTGHGLWICRRLAHNYFGSIELKAYRGGVTFDVEFPLAGQLDLAAR